jgi:hypothetical protein
VELGKNMGRYRFVPLLIFCGFCKFYKLRKEEESAKGRRKRKIGERGYKNKTIWTNKSAVVALRCQVNTAVRWEHVLPKCVLRDVTMAFSYFEWWLFCIRYSWTLGRYSFPFCDLDARNPGDVTPDWLVQCAILLCHNSSSPPWVTVNSFSRIFRGRHSDQGRIKFDIIHIFNRTTV